MKHKNHNKFGEQMRVAASKAGEAMLELAKSLYELKSINIKKSYNKFNTHYSTFKK
jgi:hypothetical protein